MAEIIVKNKVPAFETIKTLVGNENQVIRELGLPFTVRDNSTLNKILGIEPTTYPPTNQIPTIGYFCIGAGGAEFTNAGANNQGFSPVPYLYQHEVVHTGLFKMIPFVMREQSNDLTIAERAKYGLRTLVETSNGTTYVAYYLKRLDLAQVRIESKVIRKTGENEFTESILTDAMLNPAPTPRKLSVTEENILKATYVETFANVKVSLNSDDLNELSNVLNILTGSPFGAPITEIGLVSGMDKIISIATNSGNANFKEVIAAQLSHIMQCYYLLSTQSGVFEKEVQLGVSEPMAVFSEDNR